MKPKTSRTLLNSGGKYQHDSKPPPTSQHPAVPQVKAFTLLTTENIERYGSVIVFHYLRWLLLTEVNSIFYRYGPFPSGPATDHLLKVIPDIVLEKNLQV